MGIYTAISKMKSRRLLNTVLVICFVIVFGAAGFSYFEGISWIDSLYLATQTVTTVGYGDILPKTAGAKLFSIVFMLVGAGTVLYSLTMLAQFVIQSEILASIDLRGRKREMDKLQDHYIVCGAGRVGRRIIKNLRKQNLPYVIIESDEKMLENFADDGSLTIRGDATLEENLLNAGVMRAKGLASCLPDDAANIYVVLTARGLNENLHIVARAVEEQAETKLIRAGASRVVAPTIIGSQSMARALLKPAIADFMDTIVAETMDLAFEEVAITDDSPYAGKKIREVDNGRNLNLIIVAIRRKTGDLVFRPIGDTMIEEGDLLLTIGKADALHSLMQEMV